MEEWRYELNNEASRRNGRPTPGTPPAPSAPSSSASGRGLPGAGAGIKRQPLSSVLSDLSPATIGQMAVVGNQAFESAKARVESATKARTQAIHRFQQEMSTSESSQVAAKLREWNKDMAAVDADLRDAEAAFKQAMDGIDHLNHAKAMQVRRLQTKSALMKHMRSLEEARMQYEEAVVEAEMAATEARSAEATVFEGPMATELSQLVHQANLKEHDEEAPGNTFAAHNGDSPQQGLGFWKSVLNKPEEMDLSSMTLAEQMDSLVLREVRGGSGRFYGGTSCCLTFGQQPRRAFIWLVESAPFDPFILLTILCNCITMAWESPLDPPGTAKAALVDVCEVWPPRRHPTYMPMAPLLTLAAIPHTPCSRPSCRSGCSSASLRVSFAARCLPMASSSTTARTFETRGAYSTSLLWPLHGYHW